MDIFEFDNYKEYVHARVSTMPKKGYGQYRKIAEQLNMSSVMVSQIFKGERHLPMEQAFELTRHFGLNDLESRFFLLLVQIGRAGSERYQDHLRKELSTLRLHSQSLKSRLPSDKELDEASKAIFYSDWIYSGVRLLSSIEGYNTLENIASRFEISPQQTGQIIDFLLSKGLCVEDRGKIRMGASRTHLEASSPYIKSRQISWRLKGFDQMGSADETRDLFYTAPMALSQKAAQEVRKKLVQLIQNVVDLAAPSKSEEVACLNIDWFQF
jgi:uncharacterized protein (TIGR02147 family)